jgi:hypothetical protein
VGNNFLFAGGQREKISEKKFPDFSYWQKTFPGFFL